jgi:diguanylate cyclase (GGDEF)-like protein
MRLRSRHALQWYIRTVITVGLFALAVATVLARGEITGAPALFLMFTGLVVLGEMFPIEITIGNESQDVTTSTTFAFALLLALGPGPAALAQAIASFVSDSTQKKPHWKRAFNIAQYSLSILAAGAMLHVTTLGRRFGHGSLSLRTLIPVVVAGLTFFIVNHVLTGTGIALALDAPLRRSLTTDLGFYLATNTVILSLSPVVLVCAEANLLLVPLLLIPMAAAYRSAKVSVEKEHQALHDALTGLPNRVGFRNRIVQAIAEERGTPFAIVLLDMDGFKDVNDTLGHHIGDQLLCSVGQRLRGALREVDMVARLGGDEFAVFAWVGGEHDALHVARMIGSSLEESFELGELSVQTRASIGVTLFPDHGTDADTLIQRADVAMYLAKGNQTGYQLYSAERDHNTTRRLALASDLRGAIDNGELVLYFQPVADVTTGEITGVEGLVRWNHPELGLITPDEFIPLAEPTGLIEALTARVLEEGLEQGASWRAAGRPLDIAVNISVRNLYDPGFAEHVAGRLAHWGLPPSSLHLEITEGMLMADPVSAEPVLDQLHELGVVLVLDDFGTGYSSLARLKRLPVSKMKIDKSFVIGMETDENDAAIVRSTIELARSLGLHAVAEGVESERAWLMLAEFGCHSAQGYYLSRPVPAEKLELWFTQRAQRFELGREPLRLIGP